MDMNPQRVRAAQFKTVKRGLDPEEVKLFLAAVAEELERAQNHSTAMEARARAAVARLQELSNNAASQSDANAETVRTAGGETTSSPVSSPTPAAPVEAEKLLDVTVDQSETISRTLLLAQRTADSAVAEARLEAQRIRDAAETEIAGTVESSQATAQALLVDARAEARKAGEHEKVEIAGEVDSLMARRDFLESDVDHMEQFLVAQRSRLRDAASEIMELTERVPSGLGESRRPLLSAASDDVVASNSADAGDHSAAAIATDDTAEHDNLWLPDDVVDTSAIPALDDLVTAPSEEGDAGSGLNMKFGFDLDSH